MKKSDSLLTPFEFVDKNILIISPDDWGEIYLSKHHYAIELAKKNRVWFLNSYGSRRLKKLISIKSISENINVIEYRHIYYGLSKFPPFLLWPVNFLISKIIKSRIGKIDVVWTFDQIRFFNLNLFNSKIKIFQPVDFIAGYNKFKIKIADSADIIFSVSNEILNNIISVTEKININHAISLPVPGSGEDGQLEINKGKVNIAYIGNIYLKYIDQENFLNIILLNENCDFHIIGPVGDSNIGNTIKSDFYNKLSSLKNVYFHGIMKQQNLLNTLESFDIFFTCYDWVKYPERISNSHKLLEYLYTGKTTVTNYFSAYDGISEDILIMLNLNKDIAGKINEVSKKLDLYNSVEHITKRREFARQFTYEKNIIRIQEKINKLLKEKRL